MDQSDRDLFQRLLENREKLRKRSADYCRLRYATDTEYVAKKLAYKNFRYSTDPAYRENLREKARDACAREGALRYVRRLFGEQ